jgi:capsular polysaccharide transport system ATP-binding protein
MIRLEGIRKTYRAHGVVRVVADGISCTFPARTPVALFGRNGAGKSTLLRIIAGTEDHEAGRVIRHGRISWPVGFAGSFHGDMTGAQNARFAARVCGVDSDELVAWVADFAELGAHYHLPVRTYSAGMKARLSFGIAMGIPFDTYLVDEVTAPGDRRFRDKSMAVFRQRLETAGLILVTHSLDYARRLCRHGAVLEDGRLHYFADIADALALHNALAGRARAAPPA